MPDSCMFLVLTEPRPISSTVESGGRSTAGNRSRSETLVLLAVALGLLVVSGVHPKDRFTWVLEVAPIFVAVPVLVATRRRFPLTPLAYRLIFLHALILMAGGHYTYAEVPLGFWARDMLGLAATTTTGSVISRKASSRQFWPARCCGEGSGWRREGGCSSSSPASVSRSARRTR
jgi:hypothetical protein